MFIKNRSILIIFLLAVLLRLVSVVFSEGYGWHDDHFLVIEASRSWTDGFDYNNWLPKSQENPVPSGHSFFYVGLHYILFVLLKYIGFTDPYYQMLLVRLLHALLSLATVVLGYKITKKITGDEKQSLNVMLYLSLLWFMPFLSVRNLVEWVCVPVLLYCIYIITKHIDKNGFARYAFIAGIVAGISFSIRFQSLLIPAGIGIALLLRRKWLPSLLFAAGIAVSAIIIQGITDYIIWGRPFAELGEYIRYNQEHKYDYIVNNWSMYLGVIAGMLVPPLGLFWFSGLFLRFRKYIIIALPALLFLVFHSIFPNKQERFIFTIIPFIIIAGVPAWNEWMTNSSFWKKRASAWKSCKIIFWCINIPLLLVSMGMSSKISRIDAMTYLYNKDVRYVVVDNLNTDKEVLFPQYYAANWRMRCLQINKTTNDGFYKGDTSALNKINSYANLKPEFIFLTEKGDHNKKLGFMKNFFGEMECVAVIEPSFLDKLLNRLQPAIHTNYTYFIYKIHNNN